MLIASYTMAALYLYFIYILLIISIEVYYNFLFYKIFLIYRKTLFLFLQSLIQFLNTFNNNKFNLPPVLIPLVSLYKLIPFIKKTLT